MSSGNNTTILTPTWLMITLDLIRLRFVNQLPIIFVILGSIGFIGDAFTFFGSNLRYNTFCIYSLSRSFVDVINLYINLFANFLNGFGISYLTPVNTSTCRLKLFGLVAIPQLSMNLLILSLIDRYSSTCALASPIRKIRELKYVPYLIGTTIGISSVMSLYAPWLYDNIPDMGCITTDFILNGSLYVVIHGLLTPLVMLIFVWLTYRNIRHSKQRVGVMVNLYARRHRQHFMKLAFTQVITTAFITLQWIGVYLYHISTISRQRTPEELNIHYFIFTLTNHIYYLNNVKSFYLSTLTSRLFRETLIRSLKTLF